MKFGVREICNVVLRAKAAMKVGNKVFYKNEPVIYFDSLKTSSMEGTSTTVYAQGGRGNARLIGWEGEKTVTFSMEDALISPIGFSILTGAGLIEAESNNKIITHVTEKTTQIAFKTSTGTNFELPSGTTTDLYGNLAYVEVTISKKPYTGLAEAGKADNTQDFIYVMALDEHGDVKTEPYIAVEDPADVVVAGGGTAVAGISNYNIRIYKQETITDAAETTHTSDTTYGNTTTANTRYNDIGKLYEMKNNLVLLVDYYVEQTSGAFQVDITPDRFGGNFYLEADTLFRDTAGVDLPAEFIIPNCKIQSNFTFTMAASGDPSTFTFTMDAFPDYTRWNKIKKVFAAIQVLDAGNITADFERIGTPHNNTVNKPAPTDTGATDNSAEARYNANQKPVIEELY